MGGGEVPGVYRAVHGLHLPVVRLGAPVQAVEMHSEQGALVVQHPEAVALIEGDPAAAQVVFGGVVRIGLFRLAEDLAVALRQQGQNPGAQPAVSQAPEHAEILQKHTLPVFGEPRQGVAHRPAAVGDQQGVIPPHVHQPQHGAQGLQLRAGKIRSHFVLIEGGELLFIQQL